MIHRGSGESKDGTDRIEKTVNEIRDMLREAGLPEKASAIAVGLGVNSGVDPIRALSASAIRLELGAGQHLLITRVR